MPLMKMLAERSVSTRLGHMLAFKANTPTNVPWEAVGDAQAAGAVIVDNEGRVDDEIAAEHQIFAVAADLRRSLLLKTIFDIMEKNDTAEFDAGGSPTLSALLMRCPLPTDIGERDELVTLYKRAQTDPNVVITWHNALPAAQEALAASTRSDIQSTAKKYKLSKQEMQALDKLPMAEAKTRLVGLMADYKGD